MTAPRYHLDEDTQSLLEEVLTMAQMTVSLQWDEAVAADLQLILTELAERMCIPVHEVQEVITDNPDGSYTVDVRVSTSSDKRPKLSVVRGGLDPEGPDDDDPVH